MSIIGGFLGIVMTSGGFIMEILQELLYNSYLISNLFFTKEMAASETLITPASKNTVKIGTFQAEEEEEEPSHGF